MSVTRQGFVAGASASFASIAIATPARAAAEFSLKYGHDLPAEHPVNVRSIEAFARAGSTAWPSGRSPSTSRSPRARAPSYPWAPKG